MASSSVWRVGQRSIAAQRRGRFVPESGQHPGRMAPDLAAEAIRRYSRPGDVVLDPMCGIGTTLVEAVHAGRHALGIEYEPRWADIARANLELAARQGACGHATVVTGDARHLPEPIENVLPGPQPGRAGPQGDPLAVGALSEVWKGRVRLVVTSPPYGSSAHGRVRASEGPGRLGLSRFERYADTQHDHANLAHAALPDLLHGLSQILASTMPFLQPDATVVITSRPWRVDGLLVDLPGLVTTAAREAGLQLIDRCVALLAADEGERLAPRHSFFQLLQTRWARARGDDWLLLAHEDVAVLRALPVPEPPGKGRP